MKRRSVQRFAGLVAPAVPPSFPSGVPVSHSRPLKNFVTPCFIQLRSRKPCHNPRRNGCPPTRSR
ncbi:hypothetical protein FBUS_08176 [Fasciolopsis buskii]|uniref:Uncharacterized protein n=1 Tax=Fasciolopsis buskii TaxID=27845 RepID=A0A8E0VPG7_9TREM|nr:hypothetical protein FBUS_08176 [Fasciolopsis buski]